MSKADEPKSDVLRNRHQDHALEPGNAQKSDCDSCVQPWSRVHLAGRVLAAPSWVISGTLADNCRFLSGKVDEAGLLFFEQNACLAYGAEDLPLSLTELGLSYHVHLPADLDWSRPVVAAENCLRLMDKVNFLDARLAVLHPPVDMPQAPSSSARQPLETFLNIWQKAGRKAADIALENIRGCDLLAHSALIIETGMNICLDIGHLFAYDQKNLIVNRDLLSRTRIFHLSAPGFGKSKSRHLPLSRLTVDERELAFQLVAMAPADAIMMPELFNWADYSASTRLLAEWLGSTI